MASPKTYIIATKHKQFAEEKFEKGSTVIDPWRYIPDQEGVTVKRLGQNAPEMISLLVPTRNRFKQFNEMKWSALSLATHSRYVEVIPYVDEDDSAYLVFAQDPKAIIGPRILLSEAWNKCYEQASGNILMHCGDDIIFKTPGWDSIVRHAFEDCEDKILLVHGDDMSPNTDALATHGFLHRRWVETVGYFLPPLFSCDWNDVWLTEVADMIGRRVKIPIVTDHRHYSFDKRERDSTDDEREQRGRDDDVVELFKNSRKLRQLDAKKLQSVMS